MKLSWSWIMLLLIVILVLIFIVYLNRFYEPEIHYLGESVITPEQYVQVDSHEFLYDSEGSYKLRDDGTLLFEYDFYSIGNKDYPFLQKTGGGLSDYSVFYTPRKTLYEARFRLLVGFSVFTFVCVAIYALNKLGILTFSKTQKMFDRIGAYLDKMNDRKFDVATYANVVTEPVLSLIDGKEGIIGVRSWGIKDGKLKSLLKDVEWESKELFADELPDKNGRTGVYAFRLGNCMVGYPTVILGLVELDGKYQYHPDGVVRAEHCKILCFFIGKNHPNLGRYISHKYSVPTFFGDNSVVAYSKWLFSEVGQKAIQHNYELLKGD